MPYRDSTIAWQQIATIKANKRKKAMARLERIKINKKKRIMRKTIAWLSILIPIGLIGTGIVWFFADSIITGITAIKTGNIDTIPKWDYIRFASCFVLLGTLGLAGIIVVVHELGSKVEDFYIRQIRIIKEETK